MDPVKPEPTVALYDHFQRQLADLRILLDERYATQTKALDAAFVAQQTAMRTALESAEKAVNVAMIAAEKAVTKAEAAAEKRFESVNEFRGQLSDQALNFMSRTEGNIRIDGLTEKVDAETIRMTERVNSLELRLASRLDLTAGQRIGSSDSMRVTLATIAVIISLVVATVTIVGLR